MSIASFFDVNGFFGSGTSGVSEYPDASSIIKKMDYLGIDRSLVWSVEARYTSVSSGNRKLMTDISSKKEYKERLFPAFVISPALIFDEDAFAEFKKAVKTGTVRVFRVFVAGGITIKSYARILDSVKDSSAIVILKYSDADKSGRAEFLELAKQFPKLKFMMTEFMWGGFNEVLDMMWRADNFTAEISWLHTNSAIEILVKHFGAERVFFGTGNTTHYGASMASLANSDISPAAKEKIAHGNIEKILGVKKPSKVLFKESPVTKEKNIWRAFRSGRKLSVCEIIDAHAHTSSAVLGWIFETNDLEKSLDSIIDRMDALGISKTIVSDFSALYGDSSILNNEFEKIGKTKKGRILGYYAYNPHYSAVLEKEMPKAMKSKFFIGFKLLCDYWRVKLTDPRFETVWNYADKYHLPILLHTWEGEWNSPAMLTDIVKKYKNAKFILGHSGGGASGRAEAEKLVAENKNVYLEFCGSFCNNCSWKTTFEKLGYSNIIFGSDTYCHDVAWELGRLLSTPVPDEKLLPVLGANMKSILDMSKKA